MFLVLDVDQLLTQYRHAAHTRLIQCSSTVNPMPTHCPYTARPLLIHYLSTVPPSPIDCLSTDQPAISAKQLRAMLPCKFCGAADKLLRALIHLVSGTETWGHAALPLVLRDSLKQSAR